MLSENRPEEGRRTVGEYIDEEAFNKGIEERYCKPCKADGKDHNLAVELIEARKRVTDLMEELT